MSDLKIPEKIPLTIVEQDAQHVVVRPTEPPIEQPYILRPELYGKNVRKVVVRNAALYVIGLPLATVVAGLKVGFNRTFLAAWLAMFLPLVAVLATFNIWRRIVGMKKRYFSFRLWMDENGLRFERDGGAAQLVTRDEITTCLQISGKGTMVKTAVINRFFWIADELNAYEHVLAQLRRWGKLQEDSKLPLVFRTWVSVLVVFGGYAVMFLSQDARVVTIAGMVMLAFATYQIFLITSSPIADAQIKRQRWTVLMTLVIVAGRILYVWMR